MTRKGDKKSHGKFPGKPDERARPGVKNGGKPRGLAAGVTPPAKDGVPRAERRRRRQQRRAEQGHEPRPAASPRAQVQAPQGSRDAGFDVEESSGLELEMSAADVASEEVPELGLGSRMVPPSVLFVEATDNAPPTPPAAQSGDMAEQIRALEARLDGMMRGANAAAAAERVAAQPKAEVAAVPAAPDAAAAAPPAISESPYFEQQWGRLGLRSRSEEVDDFGLDPLYEKRTRSVAEFLYKSYFRTLTEGVSNVPAEGRCIIVANHSGTLPIDGIMLRTALRLEHPASRDLRWLAEDFLFYLPFAGVFLNRVGAVRACQENAERLLSKESLVAVFPEGVHGIKKLFRERYRLQRFGRGGYIRLALRMRAPLVPCAIVGAEETNPILYRVESLAGLFGLPYIPITPTFPLLGPVGLLPAPTRWRIKFGEPINLDSYGPEAADDQLLVGRLSDRVRGAIQGMLESGLRERRSVWFG